MLIERAEWTAFEDLLTRVSSDLVPLYGDYAISHPDLEDFDASVAGGNVPVAARYTAETHFLVYKEGRVRDVGMAGYAQVAQWISVRPEFSGQGFSWGDDFIENCSSGTASCGNHEIWRKVGTAHHIAMVLSQL
jgi:hypothetical protein